jgi:hypothetical protein
MNAASGPFLDSVGKRGVVAGSWLDICCPIISISSVNRRGSRGKGVVAAARLEKRLYPTKDSPWVSKTLLVYSLSESRFGHRGVVLPILRSLQSSKGLSF